MSSEPLLCPNPVSSVVRLSNKLTDLSSQSVAGLMFSIRRARYHAKQTALLVLCSGEHTVVTDCSVLVIGMYQSTVA